MVSETPSIDLKNVSKIYKGRIHALRNVDIQVHPGEIYGLLGPNGAGKSTLVKILMTVVRATHVEGTMLGDPIGRKSTLTRVGYLPEHHRFPHWLTGRQAIEFSAALCKIPRVVRRRRTNKLLEQMMMTDWADSRIGTYSKGMQQRIGLAAALVNDPELVLLDEPTDGVDPVGRREIRDILVEMRDEGRSVLVNSHILSELELVCDRVGILVKGEVATQGSIGDLTADSQRYEVLIAGDAPNWLADFKGSTIEVPDAGTKLVIPTADPESIQPILDRLRTEARTILSVQPFRESLEDLFLRAVTDPESGLAMKPGANRKRPPKAAPPSTPPGDSGVGS
ncbi:MAG: ABC transporter ATP-binding protein [Phycisphaerales bacterium]|jgi:ABC-2 type transport system ATP-binding protein|nr:ABC transporter ATP-binding protein [Phycisphaerales bacterium]